MTSAQPHVDKSRVIALHGSALDRFMPMHLWVGAAGQVIGAGQTAAKMLGGDIVGRDLFDLIAIKRPTSVTTISALLALVQTRLKVLLQAHPDLSFTALAVALPAGSGVLLNLSPRANLIPILARFELTLADFAPTDLTAEMLFLLEAKTAAFNEYDKLNARLEAGRVQAETEAMTDTLTGLHNRRAMDNALARVSGEPNSMGFGVMHIDLDYFKAVNDTLGHAAGDQVLLRVADVLREETRRDDTVARVGGDEFVVLLASSNDLDTVSKIAERIITRLEEPMQFDGQSCRISASIGTTISTFYDALIPEQILSDADKATYVSKHEGRGRHTVFRPEGHPLN